MLGIGECQSQPEASSADLVSSRPVGLAGEVGPLPPSTLLPLCAASVDLDYTRLTESRSSVARRHFHPKHVDDTLGRDEVGLEFQEVVLRFAMALTF